MIYLLQLSIASIALFVTYASVFGLGSLFASIAYPVMAAGVALEIGKYVTVSYAYQQWKTLKLLERTLLSLFVAVLMVFTSGGVFSYLGQGYQESYAGLDAKKADLQILTDQLTGVQARIKVIDGQIENLPANSVSGRIRLKREYTAEREPLVAQAAKLETEVANLKREVASSEVHSGQIAYIARITNSTVEQAATWIIAAMAVCLDPFALFMTILLNKLILLRNRDTEARCEPEPQQAQQAQQEPEPQTVFETGHLPSVMSHALAPVQDVRPETVAFDTSSLIDLNHALYTPAKPVRVRKPTPVKKPTAKVVKTTTAKKPAKKPTTPKPGLAPAPAPAPEAQVEQAPFAVGIKPQRAEVNEQTRIAP
jgi:hypothetical protein